MAIDEIRGDSGNQHRCRPPDAALRVRVGDSVLPPARTKREIAVTASQFRTRNTTRRKLAPAEAASQLGFSSAIVPELRHSETGRIRVLRAGSPRCGKRGALRG
jgi:hypothetical protein